MIYVLRACLPALRAGTGRHAHQLVISQVTAGVYVRAQLPGRRKGISDNGVFRFYFVYGISLKVSKKHVVPYRGSVYRC